MRDRDANNQLRDLASHLKKGAALQNLQTSLALFTWHFGVLKSWRQTWKRVDRGDPLWEYDLQCSRAVVRAELSFNRKTRHIVGLDLQRQPVYVAAPSPESVEAVSWQDATVGPDLGATIAFPRGHRQDKYPAVVLLGDAGAGDRDETDGPARPFRDLGDGLAARGIVTMRFDERSFVMPGTFNGPFTLDEELIQDGASAVEVVRRQATVDPARVFLVGHGLGGLAAVAVARRVGGIAGLVLAGVPARPLLYVRLEELRDHDADEDVVARAADQVRDLAAGKIGPSEVVLGRPGRFWSDLASRDTVAELRALGRPVLFLRGENDGFATAIDHQRWLDQLSGARVRAEAVPLVDHQLVVALSGPLSAADVEAGVGPRLPRYIVEMIAEFVIKGAARPDLRRSK